MMRSFLKCCCCILTLLFLVQVDAQSQSVSLRTDEGQGGGVFTSKRPGKQIPVVDMILQDVPRDSALYAIAKLVGYGLVYSKQYVKLTGVVSARFNKTPLPEAVSTVLKGTDIISNISVTSKSILLAPRDTTKSAPVQAPKSPARVKGKVIDSITREGIEGATIEVATTGKQVITDADGQFYVGPIEAGNHLLVARRIGYSSKALKLDLSEDETDTITFVLGATSTVLTSVVTTGAGDRQKYQIGNSIATIDAKEVVESESIKNISDLLANRAPGLQVFKGSGSVGSPSRLRVRGISSINASNGPIIMMDGVRISGDYTQCKRPDYSGCTASPSRLDDIDPDIIESIEVLKGPAASTLFGSDAANGVIVIKTKRGAAGPTRWNLGFDQGITSQVRDYPFPMQRLGYAMSGGKPSTCGLLDEARGSCVPIDSTIGSNLLGNPLTTSLAKGRETSVNVDVSGGVSVLQYFISVGYVDQLGTSKLPDINNRLIRDAVGISKLPGWMVRPNKQKNTSGSARLTGQFNNNSDFSLGANFLKLSNSNGPDGMSGILMDVRGPSDSIRIVPGWETFYVQRSQDVTRALTSATVNWRPLTWLTGNAVYGWDFSSRDSRELNRRNSCLPLCDPSGQDAQGYVYSGKYSISVQSLNLGSTLNRPLKNGFGIRTAVGAQYVRTYANDLLAAASDLADGGTSVAQANGLTSSEEAGGELITVGLYLDQSISLNDRLFLGAAIRRDVSSALGSEVAPLYPKWSISWVASQEPFFPWKDLVSLRLRAAYGHAGVQPDADTKLRLLSRFSDFIDENGDPLGNYLSISSIGNSNLRPERSVEREAGFELGILNDRFLLDFTVFRKFTRDAIVNRPLAPSIDFGGNQAQNIGDVLNTGAEASLSMRLLELEPVTWNLNLGYGTRKNKLITLGPNVSPFSAGSGFEGDASRVVPGYPLFSRWARPIIGFDDVNGDGVIVPDEVRVSDSLQYIGPSTSKYDLSFLNTFGFMQDRIRITANFQYVNGLTQLNRFLSQNWQYLPIMQVPGGSLEEQAYLVASIKQGNPSDYGFYEKVDFFRFNSLGVGYTIPGEYTKRLRMSSATVSLLATNLGIWTNYNGRDPDVNTASAGGNEYFNGSAFPQPRTWTLRFNLAF